MYTQYHSETVLYLERKTATKVLKKLGKAGLVESTTLPYTAKHAFDNFRVVVYHESLKQVVEDMVGQVTITWKDKDLTKKEEQ